MSIIPISERESDGSTELGLFPLEIWDPFKNFHDDSFSSLTRFNPFHEMQFSSPVPNFYPELFAGGRLSGRMDWHETATAYVVKGYLPGLTREQVTMEVEGDGRALKISADSGKFVTSFAVPEDAMIDYLDASMANGLLIVVVPKQAALALDAAPIRPNVRPIEITEVSD